MNSSKNDAKEFALESVIEKAVQIPGVKVNRQAFLSSAFQNEENLQEIIELGPVSAGISEENLHTLSTKLIYKRTSESSIASFVAGIPGGYAMAATVPLDILQFFGMSLRTAQELSYLYGAEDLWQDGVIDSEKVKNQLLLYCGVMFGVSSAVTGVRVLSVQIAKTTVKKLPQKALTKTFWYPIIKQIGKALGIKVTKTTTANGIAKVVPFVGGVVSGALNFASMMPMAIRLQKTLNQACFHYSEEDLENDILIIEEASNDEHTSANTPIKDKLVLGISKTSKDIGEWLTKKKQEVKDKFNSKKIDKDEILETIRRLKELRNEDIISEEEFQKKKDELLSML